jgi:hypothetical protein
MARGLIEMKCASSRGSVVAIETYEYFGIEMNNKTILNLLARGMKRK